MADSTLHSMTQNTAPAVTDELYLLDDPAGTPANNRITASDLLKIINVLTADTAPDRVADYVVAWDNSASDVKKVLLGLLGSNIITTGFLSFTNPADSTPYYMGVYPSTAPATTAALRSIYFMRACKITMADIFITIGTPSTSETSTMYIRKNNTTDTTLTSAIDLSASPYHELVTLGTPVSIAAGDYIEIKWTTPAWVTNPVSVSSSIQLMIE